MLLRNETLAKKYALAFLTIAKDEVTPDVVEDLKKLSLFLKNHEAMITCIGALPDHAQAKYNFLTSLEKISPLTISFQRLISLLISHKRLGLLCAVTRQIIDRYNHQHNIQMVDVITSHALDSDDQTIVSSFVNSIVTGDKGTCTITFSVDQALINGIKIKSSTMMWERSLQKLLNTIKHSLLQRVGP